MATTNYGIKPGLVTPVDAKRLANLKALAALAGHRLEQVQTGFILSRWTHSRHFDDLSSAEKMLTQMGVKHG